MPREDARLHVVYSPVDRLWWAVGREGSYGSAATQHGAAAIAEDACASSGGGTRPIVIHARDGSEWLTRAGTARPPSSQFFQDEVE